MKKLAIITSHPIQYNAPLFALLHKRNNISIEVFYTWGEEVLKNKFDPGFGKNIEWDIPLLQGYKYRFIKNSAKNKGSHHYKGIDNPSLISEIADWNPDALLVYGWSFKSHLKVLRYFHKRHPLFFRGDSISVETKNNIKKKLRRLLLKWVYKHVDKALYVGTLNKNYFLDAGLAMNQLVFAPHAIDNDRFLTNEKEYNLAAQKWKNELNIDSTQHGFLYAGKLDDNKNTELLIDAFMQIQEEDTYLIIAGNGVMEDKLKAKAVGFKNIYFLPFQNQTKMPVLLRMAEVFVLPSKSETWGLAINEAMACSRAVIASDRCGAATDLVRNSVNGFIFHSRSVKDLSEKMMLCMKNKKELKKMGMASYEIIKNWNYEIDSLAIENLMNPEDGKTSYN